jgi:alpha-glucosidase
VGEYVLVARRNGSNWYVGAMTSWTSRDLSLELSFLGAGNYEMTLYQDGTNADRNGSDYRMIKRTVTKADKLVLKLAPGGGWAAIISPTAR